MGDAAPDSSRTELCSTLANWPGSERYLRPVCAANCARANCVWSHRHEPPVPDWASCGRIDDVGVARGGVTCETEPCSGPGCRWDSVRKCSSELAADLEGDRPSRRGRSPSRAGQGSCVSGPLRAARLTCMIRSTNSCWPEVRSIPPRASSNRRWNRPAEREDDEWSAPPRRGPSRPGFGGEYLTNRYVPSRSPFARCPRQAVRGSDEVCVRPGRAGHHLGRIGGDEQDGSGPYRFRQRLYPGRLNMVEAVPHDGDP